MCLKCRVQAAVGKAAAADRQAEASTARMQQQRYARLKAGSSEVRASPYMPLHVHMQAKVHAPATMGLSEGWFPGREFNSMHAYVHMQKGLHAACKTSPHPIHAPCKSSWALPACHVVQHVSLLFSNLDHLQWRQVHPAQAGPQKQAYHFN